jgi:hypothetical protein
MNAWRKWDEGNLPPPGEYVVWHSRFKRPGEKVWTFHVVGKHFGWLNEANWPADGPPEYYCPLPRFPGARAISK